MRIPARARRWSALGGQPSNLRKARGPRRVETQHVIVVPVVFTMISNHYSVRTAALQLIILSLLCWSVDFGEAHPPGVMERRFPGAPHPAAIEFQR